MRFPTALLDEIRSRLTLSEVVGRRVRLKRQGRELVGVSPFLADDKPSFFVNDTKGKWFDFSAGKSGDVFTFLVETEGVSMEEAIRRLAAEVGISIPNTDASLLPDEYEAGFKAWLALMDAGEQGRADEFYFARILPSVLPTIRARSGNLPKYSGLISLLGFTPETSVITYKLVEPKRFAVLHTSETESTLDAVRQHLGVALKDFYHEPFLHDDEHANDILLALSRSLARFDKDAKLAVELTGGKKTMAIQLATAIATLKHLGERDLDVLYIDYDEYMPKYRKPVPETSRLVVVSGLADLAAAIFKSNAAASTSPAEMIVNPVFSGRRLSVEEQSVFVLMPFKARWSDRVWKKLQEICRKAGLGVRRADDLFGSDIMEDVWEGICRARVIIADLTSRNSNVFYELGLVHTLGKRFVLIAQDVADIPFDLQRFRCIEYSDDVDGFARLERKLLAALRERAPV